MFNDAFNSVLMVLLLVCLMVYIVACLMVFNNVKLCNFSLESISLDLAGGRLFFFFFYRKAILTSFSFFPFVFCAQKLIRNLG